MRTIDLRVGLVGLACLAACSGGGDDTESAYRDGGAEAEAPPQDEIFDMRVVETDSNGDGFIDGRDDVDPMDQMIDTATRLIFSEQTMEKYCVVPDADSFDDLENVDPNTGRIEIRRGTVPVVVYCKADGIATGPLHDELYPSKWCKRRGCPAKPEK